MAFEGIFSIISELKKKILYIVALFGAGALISFSYMGEVIKKIESDMFWNLPDKQDAAKQLLDISHNLTFISNKLAENNSIIAGNITKASNEILNISHNLNLYKPNIIFLTPMEVVMLEFKMSLIFGALIVSPLILYYVYRGARGRLKNLPFIHEKKNLDHFNNICFNNIVFNWRSICIFLYASIFPEIPLPGCNEPWNKCEFFNL